MEATTQTSITKQNLIALLYGFVAQRPRLEFGNYGDTGAYRSEARSIAKDKRDAEALIRYVALRDSITADDILRAMRGAYAGRLSLAADKKGSPYLDYCVGQYWPTEYRRAVAAVMAQCIWDWLRDGQEWGGDKIRDAARRELGQSIAHRWFR